MTLLIGRRRAPPAKDARLYLPWTVAIPITYVSIHCACWVPNSNGKRTGRVASPSKKTTHV